MKCAACVALGLLIGLYVGNKDGDQATLRDCATHGKATMVGGGEITCRVDKSAEQSGADWRGE